MFQNNVGNFLNGVIAILQKTQISEAAVCSERSRNFQQGEDAIEHGAMQSWHVSFDSDLFDQTVSEQYPLRTLSLGQYPSTISTDNIP